MDDEKILMRGGDERDIEEYAKQNGADMTLSEDAKVVWQYVAQEIDLIEKTMKPLKEAIKFLRETNQL